ncbi:hypothetical protein TrLO_g10838 [Triparma laevis f. longispina]|nr:hypothetical protein TrLO_g10838 [Triparma laevis f. longispina]
MAVTEKSMFPPASESGRKFWFDEKEQMWVSVIFPSMKPTGRHDVELLDQWLNRALAEKALGEGMSSEEQSVMVKEQLNVLMIGFREVVRQVSVQCTDRGMLLDKIWKAMSGLLDFVVKEMQDTIIACEGRMADLNLRASRHEADILQMKERHANEVKVLTQSIGHKWGKRVEVLKQALLGKEKNLQLYSKSVNLLEKWFPSFENYADTVLKNLLPTSNATAIETMVMLPEEAVLKDVRRIVDATLVNVELYEGEESEESDDDGEHEFGLSGHITRAKEDTILSLPEDLGGVKASRATKSQNQTIFRNLMSASKDYQSEIEELKAELLQLKREKGMLKSQTDQEISQLKRHNTLLHHFLMASAQTDPLEPDVSPARGFRGGRRMSGLGLAGAEGTDISRLTTHADTKVINPARTQRECIRLVKQFAEFEINRKELLLKSDSNELPNSNSWWLLKQNFSQFVRQQIMMKHPDDFHLVEKNFGLLERSCNHWSSHHSDDNVRRQMQMFSKLLRSHKTPYTPNQESLWLELSNQLHQFFSFAFDDEDVKLPLSLVPTAKALKALKKALMRSGANDFNSVWRQLPKEYLNLATEKVYKASAEKFGGLHIEIFSFFEIALDHMNGYEQQLKQGIVYLCDVASGADEKDSIDYSEFNIIIDVVEPKLPESMRVTLFHKFCENALKKEGEKWESEALAMTLMEYNLPLERLNDVYVVVMKQMKTVLEQKHNAVTNQARGVVDDLIISIVEEDDTGVVKELEKRIFQVKKMKNEAMKDGGAAKGKVEAAFLACIFLETETKTVVEKLNEVGGSGFQSDGLVKAISMNREIILKTKFNLWRNLVQDEVARRALYSNK